MEGNDLEKDNTSLKTTLLVGLSKCRIFTSLGTMCPKVGKKDCKQQNSFN